MKIIVHPDVTAGELATICSQFDLQLVNQPGGQFLLMPKGAPTPSKRFALTAQSDNVITLQKALIRRAAKLGAEQGIQAVKNDLAQRKDD